MTINLSPETVAIAKDLLVSGFEGKTKSFIDCFDKSETVTAKHILFEQYKEKTGMQIPKLFVYIVMDDLLGQCTGKDEHGYAGYHLKINL